MTGHDHLDCIRRRAARMRLAGRVLYFGMGLLLLAVVYLGADMALYLSAAGLVTGTLTFALAFGLGVCELVVREFRHRPSKAHAARLIEERCAIEDNLLINWVQLADRKSVFVDRIAEAAAARLTVIEPRRVVTVRVLHDERV